MQKSLFPSRRSSRRRENSQASVQNMIIVRSITGSRHFPHGHNQPLHNQSLFRLLCTRGELFRRSSSIPDTFGNDSRHLRSRHSNSSRENLRPKSFPIQLSSVYSNLLTLLNQLALQLTTRRTRPRKLWIKHVARSATDNRMDERLIMLLRRIGDGRMAKTSRQFQ